MDNVDDHDLEQLIYISSATKLMSSQELADMLTKIRRKNLYLDVSGMLVYNEGSFIQVLEGKADTLDKLFNKIETDDRHTRCIVLIRQKIAQRAFEGWFMGFRSVSKAEIEDLVGYIDFFDDSPIPERGATAYRLLNSFAKQRNSSRPVLS